MKKKRKTPAPPASRPSKAANERNLPFAVLKVLRDRVVRESAAEPLRPPVRVAPKAPEPEDEALALHRMLSGVKPLDFGRPSRIPRSQRTLEPPMSVRTAGVLAPEEVEIAAVHERLDNLLDEARFEVVDDGRRVEGRRPEVPPDAVRKLRRGILPIDGRLDLHGLGVEAARQVLEKFLGEQRARRERCVLVIHGKGDHSPRGHGVLRGEIAAWLSQGRAAMHVAAFTTAIREDGGEGAVYVLLSR